MTLRKTLSVLLGILAALGTCLSAAFGYEGFIATHHGWGAEVAMAEAMMKALCVVTATIALLFGFVAYYLWPRAPKRHVHDDTCQQCGHSDTH